MADSLITEPPLNWYQLEVVWVIVRTEVVFSQNFVSECVTIGLFLLSIQQYLHVVEIDKIEGLSHSIFGAHSPFQIAPQVTEMNKLH